MSNPAPPVGQARGLPRWLLLLLAAAILAAIVYFASGHDAITLGALIRNRARIDGFVAAHRLLAVLAYIAVYAAAVSLSVPGAWFLTVCGGFLFGVVVGASAAVIGATSGAVLIFLVARSALGEPLLRRAGPRAVKLARGFRDDAFSYLLFLRLVPAFPFFLVNLVPALADVGLAPFIAATVLGIIPAAAVFAFAGTGLGSVIGAQEAAHRACLSAGGADCDFTFGPHDVLTPRLIGALVALGLLALLPVLVKHLRGRLHS